MAPVGSGHRPLRRQKHLLSNKPELTPCFTTVYFAADFGDGASRRESGDFVGALLQIRTIMDIVAFH